MVTLTATCRLDVREVDMNVQTSTATCRVDVWERDRNV